MRLDARLQILVMATIVSAATAETVRPVSYDMKNGDASLHTYYDDTYNGSGNRTQARAWLSGGLGDLTDGIIATESWATQHPRYVGWLDSNPTITFHFSKTFFFERVTLWLDDSSGGGDVAAPSKVTIKIGAQAAIEFPVQDPASSAPFAFTADLLAEGDRFEITLSKGANARWVMLSEVAFEGGSDCNHDGRVDSAQILSGELEDENLDGVPDLCQTTVTAVTPVSGSASGGTPITVKGTQFPENPSVLIGGVPATEVLRVSAFRIIAITPPGLPGLASVTVSDSVRSDAFLYQSDCIADIDQNGIVDTADISMLLLDFGPCSMTAADSDSAIPTPFILRHEATTATAEAP